MFADISNVRLDSKRKRKLSWARRAAKPDRKHTQPLTCSTNNRRSGRLAWKPLAEKRRLRLGSPELYECGSYIFCLLLIRCSTRSASDGKTTAMFHKKLRHRWQSACTACTVSLQKR